MPYCLWGIIVLAFAASLAAQPVSRSLRWDQIAPAVVGKKVVVELRDGSRVEGQADSVGTASLVLNIESNDHERYKKGQAAIPRADILRLRVRTGGTHAFLGLAAGTAAGIVAAKLILNTDCRSGFLFNKVCDYDNTTIGTATAVGVAIPVAGFLIGRKTGHQETQVITILPDQREEEE